MLVKGSIRTLMESTLRHSRLILLLFVAYSLIVGAIVLLAACCEPSDLLKGLLYIGTGLISLFTLLYVQGRSGIPFPFLSKMPIPRFLAVTLGTISVVVAMEYVVSPIFQISYPSINNYADSTEFIATILAASFVAITEESAKVTLTNILAWHFRDAGPRKKRWSVIIAGIVSVVIWSSSHIIGAGYSTVEALVIFLGGLVLFYVTYRFQNYLPAIVTHMIWDTFFH